MWATWSMPTWSNLHLIQSGVVNVGVDLAVDQLTAVMLLVVTGIELPHPYLCDRLHVARRRLLPLLLLPDLFLFFMLALVLGANYLLLFVGWEGVGLSATC